MLILILMVNGKSLDRDHRFREKERERRYGAREREKKQKRKKREKREKQRNKKRQNLQKNATLLLLGMASVGGHTDLDGLLEEL